MLENVSQDYDATFQIHSTGLSLTSSEKPNATSLNGLFWEQSFALPLLGRLLGCTYEKIGNLWRAAPRENNPPVKRPQMLTTPLFPRRNFVFPSLPPLSSPNSPNPSTVESLSSGFRPYLTYSDRKFSAKSKDRLG